jgi:cytochrome c oxidase assembly protein subunit 15
VHGVIEFGNRLLTYVLIAVAIATFVAVWRWAHTSRSLRQHAGVLAVGVPFQGVIGGITVLTDLNPWIVSLHLLLSMGLVAGSIVLVVRVSDPARPPLEGLASRLAIAVYVLVWVAVYLGTIVTGSGPHAGDVNAPRNELDPQLWSRIHALSVWALVLATLVLVVALRGTAAYRSALVLLGVELGQGLIGYVQYFTDLPIALVATHLVGAAVLVAAATHTLARVRGIGQSNGTSGSPSQYPTSGSVSKATSRGSVGS